MAGLGALVAAWALLWNRSRGRKRCPKCWYDMAGVEALPAGCPECGRIVRRKRHLRRTKRRWFAAFLAAAPCLLGAWIALHTAALHDRGWVAALPDDVLVRWTPLQTAGGPGGKGRGIEADLSGEFAHRMRQNAISDRALGIYLDRLVEENPRHWKRMLFTRNAWPSGVRMPVTLNPPWFLYHMRSRFDVIRVIGPFGDGFDLQPRKFSKGERVGCGNELSMQFGGLLGLPDGPGPHAVTIELLEGAFSDDNRGAKRHFMQRPRDGRVLWRHEAFIAAQVGKPVAAHIRPVDVPALDRWFDEECVASLRIDGDLGTESTWLDPVAQLRFENVLTMPRIDDAVAVAMEIEVLRDGLVVASGGTVWTGWDRARWRRALEDDSEWTDPFPRPLELEVCSDRLFDPSPERARWSARIRPAVARALRYHDTRDIWDGAMTFAIALDTSGRPSEGDELRALLAQTESLFTTDGVATDAAESDGETP